MVLLVLSLSDPRDVPGQEADFKSNVRQALAGACVAFHDTFHVRGGYVYYYAPDQSFRLGEGAATSTQVWVQPPGTPAVGLAFLQAYRATRDERCLKFASEAGRALVYGQLQSGGWTNLVDFDPGSKHAGLYRNGKGKGRNYSSLDDGQTQTALRFLIELDEALEFQDKAITEAAFTGLEALLAAQFRNGAFPQVWQRPTKGAPSAKAAFPDYDWRTEGRIKEYWNYYTLNDDLCVDLIETLASAHRVYRDPRMLDAIERLGQFLMDAQLPAPQPAWAQQYNYQMVPIWARAFEPPAVATRESQGVVRTLLRITEITEDNRYLECIPEALEYLERSTLADGKLARYYELRTNKPLYMRREGKSYSLTYSEKDLPSHYGWKWDSEVDQLRQELTQVRQGKIRVPADVKQNEVDTILAGLNDQNLWVSRYDGQRLVGQPKFSQGQEFIDSAVFNKHVEKIARFLQQK